MKTILLALICLAASPLLAQPEVVHQNLFWIRYYNILNLTPKWSLHHEADTRHFFPGGTQHLLIFHSHFVYRPSPAWQLGGGLTYSLQRPQTPDLRPRPAKPEIRPWQEVSYNWTLSPQLGLSGRIRTEERFLSNNLALFDKDYRFVFRHRYRVQLTYLLKQKDLSFKMSDEAFMNAFSPNLFDQNRVYLGVEKRFTPKLAVEVGYINVRQLGRSAQRLYHRDNLRLTLMHTLRPI